MSELAPYACHPDQSRGRLFPESRHSYRNCFQRDRDRIIHSAAFRRLEFKTQVFGYHESDYVRNRLTHTLEVSQISRSLARALNLNEDLAEAIALSHDLGHPPFGHAGERALNRCAESAGGFNHNIQGLRIVDRLEERYAEFNGLNLSFEVREAFGKHGSGRERTPEEFSTTGSQAVLEAQIVDLVDELTYTSHDIDDGIAHNRLRFSQLEALPMWAEPFNAVRSRYPDASDKIVRHETIRRVINWLATDLHKHAATTIEKSAVATVDEVRGLDAPLIQFPEQTAELLAQSKQFLVDYLYTNFQVVQMNQKADRIVTSLYGTFFDVPDQLPPRFRQRAESDGVGRAVTDYISGMTDKFALELYGRLFSGR